MGSPPLPTPVELAAQQPPAAVDAGPHGADRPAGRSSDLLVGQPLDVAQHDRRAEARWQLREGVLEWLAEDLAFGLLLGARVGIARLPPLLVGPGFDRDTGPAPDPVEEQVLRDAVEPALERARSVAVQVAVHAHED